MKGYISNRGYKVINTILWVIAIAGMLGLLCALHELKGLTKDASNFRIVNQK
jgi:hypothetical protein